MAPIVVAFVKRRPNEEGEALTMESVREYGIKRMARYKVPKHVFFVDDFPQNAAKKILKYKLREQAAELLQRPDCSVAYISRTVGYANASHFARVFKAYYQVSPLEYRKQFFARSTRG